jgi:hypothetical protein
MRSWDLDGVPDLVILLFVAFDTLHVAGYADYCDYAFFFGEEFGVVWSFGHVEYPDDADSVVKVSTCQSKGYKISSMCLQQWQTTNN